MENKDNSNNQVSKAESEKIGSSPPQLVLPKHDANLSEDEKKRMNAMLGGHKDAVVKHIVSLIILLFNSSALILYIEPVFFNGINYIIDSTTTKNYIYIVKH